ncbi:MAG: hypothetical protein IPO13_12560 [Rhodocyclaceae bacterium]|nr:hypothetical protein [Rhodocyclaceae bacterium]
MEIRTKKWATVTLLFLLAAVVQVLVYGGPQMFGFKYPQWIPRDLLVLFFFVGPEICVAMPAWLILRTEETGKPSPESVAILIVLGLVFSYLGVFISFNTWGT